MFLLWNLIMVSIFNCYNLLLFQKIVCKTHTKLLSILFPLQEKSMNHKQYVFVLLRHHDETLLKIGREQKSCIQPKAYLCHHNVKSKCIYYMLLWIYKWSNILYAYCNILSFKKTVYKTILRTYDPI